MADHLFKPGKLRRPPHNPLDGGHLADHNNIAMSINHLTARMRRAEAGVIVWASACAMLIIDRLFL